jgi:hypothetical protein
MRDRAASPSRRTNDPLMGARFLLLLALVAASCAERAAPPAATPQPTPVETPLPTLPPAWALEPDLFDENGCAKLGDGTVDCGAPPLPGEAATEEATGDPLAWRSLLGFVGPYHASELRTGAVILLQDSLTIASRGPWRAWGLVRNETAHPAGADVAARLFAADGMLLTTVTGHVPVDPLRPGEPGPFALSSDIAVSDVAAVKWSVLETPPGPAVIRDLQILEGWSLPFGDRAREDGWYRDPPGPPPYPFVQFGSVDNLGDASALPLVTAAWVDENDRVVWVATAQVGDVPGNPGAAAVGPRSLGPRVLGDYYFVISDPSAGPLLSSGTVSAMLWAAGTPPDA